MNSLLNYIIIPHFLEKFNSSDLSFKYSYITADFKKKKKNYLETWLYSLMINKLSMANVHSYNIKLLLSLLYLLYSFNISSQDNFFGVKLSKLKNITTMFLKLPFKCVLPYYINVEKYYTYYQFIFMRESITLQIAAMSKYNIIKFITLLTHLKVPLTR